MVGTKAIFKDLQTSLVERFRFGAVAHVIIECSQFVYACCDVDGAGLPFLANAQTALQQWLSFTVLTHLSIESPEVINHRPNVWVINTKCPLIDFQSLLVERQGF